MIKQRKRNLSTYDLRIITIATTLSKCDYGIRVLEQGKTYRGVFQCAERTRLSGLALMHIHKHDVSLNSEDIVDDFAASGSRRMELPFRLTNSSTFSNATDKVAVLTLISINLPAFSHECCSLISYATHYLFCCRK